MQLIYFAAILVTLLTRHIALMPSWSGVSLRLEVIAGLFVFVIFSSMIAIWHVIPRFGAEVGEGDRLAHSLRSIRSFYRNRSALQWIWVFVFLLVAPISGWPQWLHRDWPTNCGLCVEFLGCLLPTIGFFVWLDGISFGVERHALASVRTCYAGQLGLGRFIWLHVQHSWMLVLPFALISCLTFDAVRWMFPRWNETQQAALIGCVSILLAQILAPAMLSRTWQALPLPRDERYGKLWRIWQQLGLDHCPILVWSTQRRMANAVVVGVLPGQKRLYLTECLLDRTSPDELEMIVLHEASHVLRHHAWIRCLPMLVAFGAMLLLAYLIDHSSDHYFPIVIDWVWIASTVFGVVMIWGLGALARWSERDADRYAIGLAVRLRCDSSYDPFDASRGTMRRQAAKDLISALMTICPDGQRKARSWLYPSVEDRIRWIESYARDSDGMEVANLVTTGCNG